MKSDYPVKNRRQDSQTLRHALYRLNATATILCVVMISVVGIIWWGLLNRLISFGANLDYSGLEALSVQNLALLKQYNPFFWWTVVGLISLLLAYVLLNITRSIFRHNRERIVDKATIAGLARELSPNAKAVMLWVWTDPMHPITVGVLQRGYQEIRTGRLEKMQLAQEHSDLLQASEEKPDDGPQLLP